MLKTEMRNENTTHIDSMDTLSMLKAIQKENDYVNLKDINWDEDED